MASEKEISFIAYPAQDRSNAGPATETGGKVGKSGIDGTPDIRELFILEQLRKPSVQCIAFSLCTGGRLGILE
jgi:hypothetical protein